VNWDVATDDVYKVTIEISAMDRPGMLTEIMMVAAEIKINVSSVNAKTFKNKTAAITLCLEISSLSQLEQVMTKMRRVRDVYSVHRAASNAGGAVCER
jgi:GTP pyrophosphokinase